MHFTSPFLLKLFWQLGQLTFISWTLAVGVRAADCRQDSLLCLWASLSHILMFGFFQMRICFLINRQTKKEAVLEQGLLVRQHLRTAGAGWRRKNLIQNWVCFQILISWWVPPQDSWPQQSLRAGLRELRAFVQWAFGSTSHSHMETTSSPETCCFSEQDVSFLLCYWVVSYHGEEATAEAVLACSLQSRCWVAEHLRKLSRA